MRKRRTFGRFLYSAYRRLMNGRYLSPEEYIRLIDEGLLIPNNPKKACYDAFLAWQMTRRIRLPGKSHTRQRTARRGGRR